MGVLEGGCWQVLGTAVTYWFSVPSTGINHPTVDRKAKTFSIADEFVLNTFRAHLLAVICDQLRLKSPSDLVSHDPH